MDALERLFDSPARAKVLKLLLMNPDLRFSAADACRQIRIQKPQFLAEIKKLGKLGVIRTAFLRTVGDGKRRTGVRKAVPVYYADQNYPLYPELRNLILKAAPHAKGQLTNRLRRLGTIRLAILSGVFIGHPSSRVDLFIVGDGIKKSRMKSFVQWLEAEIGRELNYVAMSSQEFKYRLDMYDRFVRDILELPHETIVNKLGVS